ncbi:MAG: hypothetical protein JXB88_25265 [Spirochaetales bacterium]|nr:hypothetical protein [Spirochaetales bacterium]
MKSVHGMTAFVLFLFTLAAFSQDDPTKDTIITYPDSVTMQSGSNAEIEVGFTIPSGNYIFVEHLSEEDVAGILTSFSIDESSGFVITDIKKPSGKKLENEIILSDKGTYTLIVSDKAGHSPGTHGTITLEITIQLCNRKKGICYLPRTRKQEITFRISDFTWSAKDYENYTYKTFAAMPEANSRIDFNNIDYPLLHAAIFFETNRQRDLQGKKAFAHSPALETAAKGHSDDMVKKNFFSHNSPVKGKETMKKRLELVGISNAYSGENIAYSFGIEYKAGKSVYSPEQNGGYFSYTFKGKPIENHTYLGFAKEVLNQWMNSPGHRANILNSKYTYLGAGASHYKNMNFYGMDNFKCTQNFSSVKGPEKE